MADTVYLKVKNWKRFQQYKDGRPLRWIKLYVKLLGDYDFEQLPERTQLHLVKIWLVAAEQDNRIPCEPEWIARQIAAKSDVDVLTMVEEGWLGVHSPHDVENVRKALSGGDVQSRTGRRTQRALARGEKRREEESTVGSSLRSSPTEDKPRVENPQGPLCEAIREAAWTGGEPDGWSMGQSISVAKQLTDRGYSWEDLEAAVRGLRGMAKRRHESVRDWIAPEDSFTMRVFRRADESGQKLIQLAAHEWRKHGSASHKKRRPEEPEKLEVAL
jgi:hypothetical protein